MKMQAAGSAYTRSKPVHGARQNQEADHGNLNQQDLPDCKRRRSTIKRDQS